ncbi:lysophosphatidylcholine acyltransferase [Silanimonas algicola]
MSATDVRARSGGALVPALPPMAPRGGGAPLWRHVATWVLRAGGWRIEGEWPDEPRLVIIAAPHSSAWDAVWGFAMLLAMDLGVVFMAKKEIFVGPLAWYLRRMGGLAVDRAAPGGVVDQVATRIRDSDRMWFVLAPEGTRRRVDKWKTGFWKIARAADVPVLCAAFDYPNRCVRIGPLVRCSDDVDADMAAIRDWYRPFMGKNRGTV